MLLSTFHCYVRVLTKPERNNKVHYVLLYIKNAAVPEPPSNLQAFSTGSRSTVLTWQEPHASNSPILYYIVSYTQPEFFLGDKITVENVTLENATITNLFPGVDYMFTVTAHNEIGSSAPSQPLLVRTQDEGKEYETWHHI